MFNVRDGHAWVEERLSAYVDGQLAPNERAQLENHLRDCARCQASLASLKWTISLLKQAPAPALPRSFILPRQGSRGLRPESAQPAPFFRFGFGALRAATALATLVLCAVVGADLILQFGGASAPAFAPAAREVAAPTQAALVPPTIQPSAADKVAPTPLRVAGSATSSPQPTAPPPQLLAQPKSAATPPPAAGAAQAQATLTRPVAAPPAPRAADGVTTTLTAGVQLNAPSATPTPTRAAEASLGLAPTATPTVIAATSTPAIAARVEPTLSPLGTRISPSSSFDSSRAVMPSLRIVQVGLLALVIVLGALTFVTWRRK